MILKITNPPLIVTPTAPSYELTRTLALSEPLTLATITGGSGTSTDAIAEALPAGLTLDNGRLIGTPTTTAAVATFTYTVTDSDTALTAQSFTFTITISDPPALDIEANGGITTKTFFRGATDTFTPAAFVGTSTGFGDKTFAISSPATGLPAGLSLNVTTGVISGNPEVLSGAHAATPTPPAASYTIKVTDSFTTPHEDSVTFTLVTDDPALTLTIDRATVEESRNTSVSNSTAIATSVGGLEPRTLGVSPALPNGLLLSNTGVLSGKATVAAASTTHTLTVTDNFGRTATGTFDLTVIVPAAPRVEDVTNALASAPVAGSKTTIVSLGEITFDTPGAAPGLIVITLVVPTPPAATLTPS